MRSKVKQTNTRTGRYVIMAIMKNEHKISDVSSPKRLCVLLRINTDAIIIIIVLRVPLASIPDIFFFPRLTH